MVSCCAWREGGSAAGAASAIILRYLFTFAHDHPPSEPMIFEAAGLGTARFDVASHIGEPDTILIVRTRWIEEHDAKRLAEALLEATTSLWADKAAVVRMQIYGDQTAESLSMLVFNIEYSSHFATRALQSYRTTLCTHRSVGPQPPITHEVCFLPTGKTVTYQGRD